MSMRLQARTASRMWASSCNARACCRWSRQSVQRVVHGLNAALLERVMVEIGVGSLVA